MKVMITGAQFNNKGAQSLLFTVVDQLKKKFSDIEIYYLPIDDYRKYEKEKYKFHIVYGDMEAHYYENKPYMRLPILAKAIARKVIKGKNAVKVSDVSMLHRILPQIDAIIDVSGFQLTSKFSNEMNRRFLYYIEEAKKYSKKVILMPQSFGPFDYTEDRDNMLSLIRKDLSMADVIFAREQEGYFLLINDFQLNNVWCSTDLVLQSNDIDWNNIYMQMPEFNYPKILGQGNIAIIPNIETFKHGNEEDIIILYRKVIEYLLEKGKKIHIFRHSYDMAACEKIYSCFEGNEKVFLYRNEFESGEYSLMVRQFDFIIASRYHSIVHAYKEGIPAVIFGWAIKYQELAKHFDQSKYVFDITNKPNDKLEAIVCALDAMCKDYSNEGKRIIEKSLALRKESCFDICWDIL